MSCQRTKQAINIGTVKIAIGQEVFLVTWATLGSSRVTASGKWPGMALVRRENLPRERKN